MIKKQLDRVQGIIKSLGMSTRRTIVGDGLKIELGGLCSEYAAHQSATVERSGILPKDIYIISNERYWILISRWGGGSQIQGKILTVLVPSDILKNLFQFPIIPDLGDIITVYIPDNFTGFDETGKPIFKESEISLEWKIGEYDYKYILQKEIMTIEEEYKKDEARDYVGDEELVSI